MFFNVKISKDLEDLIPDFIDSRKKEIIFLEELLELNNFEKLKEITHSIKGVSGSYGFDKLSELAAHLEEYLIKEDFKKSKKIIIKMEKYINKVKITYVEEEEEE